MHQVLYSLEPQRIHAHQDLTKRILVLCQEVCSLVIGRPEEYNMSLLDSSLGFHCVPFSWSFPVVPCASFLACCFSWVRNRSPSLHFRQQSRACRCWPDHPRHKTRLLRPLPYLPDVVAFSSALAGLPMHWQRPVRRPKRAWSVLLRARRLLSGARPRARERAGACVCALRAPLNPEGSCGCGCGSGCGCGCGCGCG